MLTFFKVHYCDIFSTDLPVLELVSYLSASSAPSFFLKGLFQGWSSPDPMKMNSKFVKRKTPNTIQNTSLHCKIVLCWKKYRFSFENAHIHKDKHLYMYIHKQTGMFKALEKHSYIQAWRAQYPLCSALLFLCFKLFFSALPIT